MDENYVSVNKASEILGVGYVLLNKSIHSGLIEAKTEYRKGGSKIRLIDLNKIDKKTIFLLKVPLTFRKAYLQRNEK